MQFDIITIFPKMFDSYLEESILGRAIADKKISVTTHDLRSWTTDKHHCVDDSPYGGGVGMVMMVEPLYKALMSLRGVSTLMTKQSEQRIGQGTAINPNPRDDQIAAVKGTLPRNDKTRVILLTPRGKRLTQKKVKELSQYDQLILVAGRYEGVDERVTEFVDEQISIGDYVLAGGELAAMIVVEAVSRLVPGVLGKDESSHEESFSDDDSTEYPHYTRPEVFTTDDGRELKVPDTLLSGNHAAIAAWRKAQRKKSQN